MGKVLLACVLLFSCVAGKGAIKERARWDDLVRSAEIVVHGKIVRHWSAWDAEHRIIWTHYQLQSIDVLAGRNRPAYTISEPGGVVGEVGLEVSGAVRLQDGEEVLVLLHSTPIGYQRLCGGPDGRIQVRVLDGLTRAVMPSGAVRPLDEVKSSLRRRLAGAENQP